MGSAPNHGHVPYFRLSEGGRDFHKDLPGHREEADGYRYLVPQSDVELVFLRGPLGNNMNKQWFTFLICKKEWIFQAVCTRSKKDLFTNRDSKMSNDLF